MNLNFMARGYSACSLLILLSSCAFTPWKASGVPGATPEARTINAEIAQQKQPEKISAMQDVHVTREQAAYDLLQQAETALREGRADDANTLYNRLLEIDPSSSRAQTGKADIARAREQSKQVETANSLFAKGKTEEAESLLHQVLLQNPDYLAALALAAQIKATHEVARNAPPHLKPPFDKPVSLELRDANIKMVFEALSRSTGINFILDKDIKPDTKATVFINHASIEDAIDLVLSTNGLQKKALSETTALVYPNTAAKTKDYQDLIIRSFYLSNSSAKQVATLIKTMLKTKDVYVDDRLNMITMRDTPEVIRIAEKLVASNDLADPEVMLEMEVLEVTRSRLQELGITYPTQLTAVGNGAAGTSAALTLQALNTLNASGISVSPNPALNFRKTTGDVNVLSNPRIRVRNNEKAKVLVGDKVPIITTVATAGVGSSQTVQYLDVGLKLEVEPRVTLDDFVNIKIALEVSSLGNSTAITGGGLVYQISTRNASTLLRLKDGETQILAGLISADESKNTSKLPGLGDIPLLGRLFSDQTDKKDKTEIVLAITPRILNNIRRPDAEISEYWSGTESVINDRAQTMTPVPAGNAATNARDARQSAPQVPDVPSADPVPPTTQPETPQEPSAPVDPLEYQSTPSKPVIETPAAPAL